MTPRPVLQTMTARSGADSTLTGGRRLSSASGFLRIVPIRRHPVAPPLGQQGRVSVFTARDLSVRIFNDAVLFAPHPS